LPRIFFVYKKIKKKILQGIFFNFIYMKIVLKELNYHLKKEEKPIT